MVTSFIFFFTYQAHPLIEKKMPQNIIPSRNEKWYKGSWRFLETLPSQEIANQI